MSALKRIYTRRKHTAEPVFGGISPRHTFRMDPKMPLYDCLVFDSFALQCYDSE